MANLGQKNRKAPSSVEDTQILGTLRRGLDVLDLLARSDHALTARDIAEELGIKQATVYHLLRTMRSTGHVVRLSGGTFVVGPRAAALGRWIQNRSGPSPELAAILARVHLKTEETSYICGWYHGALFLQQYMSSNHALTIRGLDVGYSGNMHARASCKAILAFLPEEQVSLMFENVRLPRLTPRTITTYESLVHELTTIRARGVAVDREEFQEGVCCMSVAFFGADGHPAGSFTVSLPVTRFHAKQAQLATVLQEAATMATNLLQAKERADTGTGDGAPDEGDPDGDHADGGHAEPDPRRKK